MISKHMLKHLGSWNSCSVNQSMSSEYFINCFSGSIFHLPNQPLVASVVMNIWQSIILNIENNNIEPEICSEMDVWQNSVFIQNGLIKINKSTQLHETQFKKNHPLSSISSWIGIRLNFGLATYDQICKLCVYASDFPFSDSMKYWKHFGKL